ncbi:hypothetical protein ACFLUV_04595 [Elusimicrobiota bacterium]
MTEIEPKKENRKEDKEKELNQLENDLKLQLERLVDIKINPDQIDEYIKKILTIIPQIKKKRGLLKFEKAVSKYKEILITRGINRALLDHVIEKRRQELSEKLYELSLNAIIKIEKKRGIFSKVSITESKIFEIFRFILPQTTDIDEIEVIVRKLKLKLDSEKKKRFSKEEMVRYFVYEAGFQDMSAVMELLLNKSLSYALGSHVVTEGRLTREMEQIKGDFSELSNKIVNRVNKKVLKMNELLGKETPVAFRVFSNYLVNPVAAAAGGIGIFAIVFYSIGRFFAGPLESYSPVVGEIFNATGIPMLCTMISPVLIYFLSIISVIIGGLLKMIDENMRKKIFNKWLEGEE